MIESIQDENGPPDSEVSVDDDEAEDKDEEDSDDEDSEDDDDDDADDDDSVNDSHKIRLMKRNIPVCNRLSGSVSRAKN